MGKKNRVKFTVLSVLFLFPHSEKEKNPHLGHKKAVGAGKHEFAGGLRAEPLFALLKIA